MNGTVSGILALVAAACSATTGSSRSAASPTVPRFAHVVVVVMENKNYGAIIGRPDEAPYINTLAAAGAVFSNSFAVTHPSQPNYLALFSGSTHGLTSDNCPQNFKTAPNLGAELIGAKLTFAGYSESMPKAGYTGCGGTISLYARKHNPWVDFSNVPAASNLTFAEFPTAYRHLPTVSFVIPNLCHDMHSCSRDRGDHWIKAHLGGYASWALNHNSLLIITWDEDGTKFLGFGGDNNKIPTIFYGAHVRPGTYSERTGHYGLLRTIEDMYGLAHAGASAHASPITDTWK